MLVNLNALGMFVSTNYILMLISVYL